MRRIVWGRATSSNVMKAIWALEEFGLPYERIDVGGSFGKTDTPEYRAMNPTGLVPTLQEDDFTLWESNAICRYLCHAHAAAIDAVAAGAARAGNVDRWMDAQQTLLNRPMAGCSGAWCAPPAGEARHGGDRRRRSRMPPRPGA